MTEDIKTGLSRRTLAKGAAWTVPAAAVVAAAPAYAKSGIEVPPCLTFNFTAESCRRSNEAIYKFGFCITNNCTDRTLEICVTKLTNTSGGTPGKPLVPDTDPGFTLCKTLEPGDQLCVTNRVWRADSQANGVRVWGTINGGPEIKLFEVDAPQKTNNCAPEADGLRVASQSDDQVVEEKPAANAEAPAKVEETAKVEAPAKVEETAKVEAPAAEVKVKETAGAEAPAGDAAEGEDA